MIEELIKRRSCRKFTDKTVEPEKIESVLKAGLLAPSGKNKRPWEFMVIDNREKLEKISKGREHGSAFLADAPVAIAVIANTEATDVWVEDCSIAAILMQMEAEKQELGSCWIQVRNRVTPDNAPTSEYIKDLLSIPLGYEVECVIALGYKLKERSNNNPDDLLIEKVSYNNFSNSYF